MYNYFLVYLELPSNTLIRENMAKNKLPPDREEQEEMMVVVLRIKGKSGTLQKGFDTVSQALSALGVQPVTQQRRLNSTQHGTLPAPGENGKADETSQVIDGEIEEVPEEDAPERESGGGTRKYAKPKYQDDLKLNPEDQIGWTDYAAQKNPIKDNQKYLVAAAWLTKHGGYPIFTVNQIFTCFRAMKWSEQADFSQPIRYMKKESSYFENKGLSKGQWKLTQVGLGDAEAIENKPE